MVGKKSQGLCLRQKLLTLGLETTHMLIAANLPMTYQRQFAKTNQEVKGLAWTFELDLRPSVESW